MDKLIAVRLPKADDMLIREIASREEIKASEVYRRAIQEFLVEERVEQEYTQLLGELESQCV